MHNNFHQDSVSYACPLDSTNCTLAFKATLHVTTQITAVNCYFDVSQGETVIHTILGSRKSDAQLYLPMFSPGPLASRQVYGINAQVNLFVAKGDVPTFAVQTETTVPGTIRCTISGFHS